jgi:hypothetical protein
MYVIGGVEDSDGDVERVETRSVLKFDRGAQAWIEVAPMPRALFNCGACVLGSNIFVLGGADDETSADSTFCYNTLVNVWTTLAPMPEARMGHGV